ncbi:MAG TPA: DUF2207 domain-containing protein, partial [Nocardioidaceae bacterium]|nr:DUF2207 domain-containing protein [Nocardioidaceae bacterium]
MTRMVALGAGVALLAAFASPGIAAAQNDGERMTSYVAWAEVGTDGTLSVTEQISYRFDRPGQGDFRILPRWYSLVAPETTTDRVRAVDVDYDAAEVDGRPVSFAMQRSESPGAVMLRVGDAADTMTGEHDFELRYRIRGLVIDPEGRRELYWETSDSREEVPVDRAEVSVTVPGPVGEVRCVTTDPGVGRQRDHDVPCATARANGYTARFAEDDIAAYDELKITVELPGNVAVAKEKIEKLPEFPVPEQGGGLGIPLSGTTLVLLVGVGGAAAWLARQVLRR